MTVPVSSPEPIYLRAEDVAELLQVSRSTVFRLAKSDRTMPALRLGGVIRFPRERLLLWLRQREQGAVARPRMLRGLPRAGEPPDGHPDGHTTGGDEPEPKGGIK